MKKFILGLCLLFLVACNQELVLGKFKVLSVFDDGFNNYYNTHAYYIHVERVGNINDKFLFVKFYCGGEMKLKVDDIILLTTKQFKDSDNRVTSEYVFDAPTEIGKNHLYCK